MANHKDRVCLITGAARGIGRSISLKLASQGAIVILTDINEEALANTVNECKEFGGSVVGYVKDLTDVSALEDLVKQTIQQFQKIDVLVNVAGMITTRKFMEITLEDWNNVFNINVTTTFLLTQLVCKEMIKQGTGGSIINFSSTAGRLYRPMAAHYAASKAAVISLTRSAAAAMASNNIRVNAICPGIIETPMMEEIREARSKILGISPEDVHANLEKAIPLGRLGTTEEVANVVDFLASDEARYITGEAIGITGGTDGSGS
jgi:NAD(P)-dependent dehydrogenase (short-subunit alcohol dehydrogenase family)